MVRSDVIFNRPLLTIVFDYIFTNTNFPLQHKNIEFVSKQMLNIWLIPLICNEKSQHQHHYHYSVEIFQSYMKPPTRELTDVFRLIFTLKSLQKDTGAMTF